MTTTKPRRRLGWHWNGSEWKYCWAQSTAACPYSDSGHTDTNGLVQQAVQKGGGALPDGRTIVPEADHLYKAIGGKRSQYFRDDGTQLSGDDLRAYMASRRRDRTRAKRLYGALSVEEKLARVEADLFRYELEDGELAETADEHAIRWQHWKAYTQSVWKGMFSAFFKSEWDRHSDAPTLRKRYRRTLRSMFRSVFEWVQSG